LKLTLNKSIEAKRLNKRTLSPLLGPEVTIPYGGILEPAGSDGDFDHIRYMGDLYRVKRETLASAVDAGASAPAEARPEPPAPPAPVPVAGGAAAAPALKPRLQFEPLGDGISRAKIPGGWLVRSGSSIAYVPDSAHKWKGHSLP
jgi:hypothetical protein